MPADLLTAAAAARELGVSAKTVRAWIRGGQLRSVGARRRYVSRVEVARVLAEGTPLPAHRVAPAPRLRALPRPKPRREPADAVDAWIARQMAARRA